MANDDMTKIQEAAKAEVSRAAQAVIDSKMSTYTARNGREVGIEDSSGEKSWIVPSDEMHALEVALDYLRATNTPEKPDSSGDLREAVAEIITQVLRNGGSRGDVDVAADAAIAVVVAHLEAKAQALPMGHETPSKGCSTYNWLMHAAREIRAPARKE